VLHALQLRRRRCTRRCAGGAGSAGSAGSAERVEHPAQLDSDVVWELLSFFLCMYVCGACVCVCVCVLMSISKQVYPHVIVTSRELESILIQRADFFLWFFFYPSRLRFTGLY